MLYWCTHGWSSLGVKQQILQDEHCVERSFFVSRAMPVWHFLSSQCKCTVRRNSSCYVCVWARLMLPKKELKDTETDAPGLLWGTDRQLNKLPGLPLPVVHLFCLYRGKGPGPCPPLLPMPLVVNWAPARPRPFIASICQSLQSWMVPESLYKWRGSSLLHVAPSLSVYPSQRANRPGPGQSRANSAATKAVTWWGDVGRWLTFSLSSQSSAANANNL